jgi:hypothetical protein
VGGICVRIGLVILVLFIIFAPAQATSSSWLDPPALSGDFEAGIIDAVNLEQNTITVEGRSIPVAREALLLRGTSPVQLASLAPPYPNLGQEARWRLNHHGEIQYLVVYYHALEVYLAPYEEGGRWARPVEGGSWRFLTARPELEGQWQAAGSRTLVVLDWEGKVRYLLPLAGVD